MHLPRGDMRILLACVGAFAVGLVLLVVGLVSATHARNAGAAGDTYAPALSSGTATASESAAQAQSAARSWVAEDSTRSITATTTIVAPAPAQAPVGRTVTPPATAVPAGSVDAYRGLGAWVDLYDSRAWSNPSATVRDMAAHGVRTLFIETANFHAPSAINNPAAMQTFITACHAQHMQIVAWYLPDLKTGSVDLDRIEKAIAFRTPDGQKFDSFALDIESTEVGSVSARNASLAALSQKIRGLVGASYPLGAIIPSPVGLAKKAGYWDSFPYAMLARTYDVFVPMAYYSYHGKGAAAAYADATANVRILRSQPGCSAKPIHLIGGLAENSSAAELQAFVRAERETGCYGASLYSWPGTTAAHWQQLASVRQ